MSKAKYETMRRLRLGDLRRLLNRRYGPSLPNDDAGREDLWELLLAISLGADPRRKMLNAISLWAPWMPQDEIDALIEGIERTPVGQRHRTGKDLGERMRLTNAERERLRLWTIAAYDMTAEERVEWRKAKARERMRQRREANGSRSQANSINRQKPWIALGISPRTWYRHRGTTSCSIRFLKAENKPVPTEQASPPLGGRVEGVPKKEPETERQNEAKGKRYA